MIHTYLFVYVNIWSNSDETKLQVEIKNGKKKVKETKKSSLYKLKNNVFFKVFLISSK